MTEPKPLEVVFFDLKDTLGEVYRPGKLTVYRPSTDFLLESVRRDMGARIGIISNLPASLTRDDGMKMIEEAGLLPALDADLIVFNHDVGIDKPAPGIYQFAAQRAGAHPWQCMFVGENLLEVIGAQAAGMKATLKPCPPGAISWPRRRRSGRRPRRAAAASPSSWSRTTTASASASWRARRTSSGGWRSSAARWVSCR